MSNPIIFPNLGIELDPPVGFELGPLNVRLYGIIIAFGLLLAVIYGLRRCKSFGLTQDDLLDGVIWIVPFAFLCARLYYCVFEWQDFQHDPIRILYVWEGGIAIYGGVIGAVLGIIVFCLVKKRSIGAVLDLVLMGFLIGQTIGRWGNFFNREAFGCYSDGLFAMQLSIDRLAGTSGPDVQYLIDTAKDGLISVHPTFLYESVWNLVGFVLLHFWSKRRRYDGQIALGYAAWYGLGRLWVEGLRMDSLWWGPFRVSQVLAGVTCILAVAALIFFHVRPPRKKLFVDRLAEEQAARLAEQEAEAFTEEGATAEQFLDEAQAEEAKPTDEAP